MMRPLSYIDTDVFLVLFSVGSRKGLENVKTKVNLLHFMELLVIGVFKQWFPEILHYAPTAKCFVVGTMTDLRENSAKGQDFVTFEQVHVATCLRKPCKGGASF